MLPAFSWLEKYIPIYLKGQFDSIHWTPRIDFPTDSTKRMLLDAHAARLWGIYQAEKAKEKEKILTGFYLDRDKIPVSQENLIETLIKHLIRVRGEDVFQKYAIWGVTPQSRMVHQWIQTLCPSAELVAVYDTYRKGDFLGKPIASPSCMVDSRQETICIVAATGAEAMATELFQQLHLGPASYCMLGPENLRLP